MLGIDDQPTIRHAIMKRLDAEPGIKVCELKIVPHERETPPFIAVGVLCTIDGLFTDNATIARSLFHLPLPEFEHRHLLNEIDEICEQMKAARKAQFGRGAGLILTPEKQLLGTGLRGRWGAWASPRGLVGAR